MKKEICKAITNDGTRCTLQAGFFGYCITHFKKYLSENKPKNK